jgi:uncharacterized protein YjbI with pentapeptide repeats
VSIQAWSDSNCLIRAQLSFGAEVDFTKLDHAVLDEAEFHAANVVCVDMTEASLLRAKLGVSDTQVLGVRFNKARLGDADFRCSMINATNFDGADTSATKLQGVDLTQANNLTDEQLAAAETDSSTKRLNQSQM